MDNTGLYVSVAKLLIELGNSGKAIKAKILLSNKTLVSGTTYTFDFVASGNTPAALDFIVQGDNYGIIQSVIGNKVTVQNGDSIITGVAQYIRTDYTATDIEKFITDAMAYIDANTRQWFNSRTFGPDNEVKVEGNNAQTLFLQVPIIEITQIKKGQDSLPINLSDLMIFNSRLNPDDRRNPMIKYRRPSGDIFTDQFGIWNRGEFIFIQGKFGFLEADGSTPPLIQRATLKLAIMYAYKSLGEAAAESSSTGDKGALKREKTDMHEVEYYDPNSSNSKSKATIDLTGDDEIDNIIISYKSPIIVAGTFPVIGIEQPILNSFSLDPNM